MWAKKSIKNYKKRNRKYTYAALYVRVCNCTYNLLAWLKLSPVLDKATNERKKSSIEQGANEPMSLVQEYKAWLFIQRIGNGAEKEMK